MNCMRFYLGAVDLECFRDVELSPLRFVREFARRQIRCGGPFKWKGNIFHHPCILFQPALEQKKNVFHVCMTRPMRVVELF